MVEQDFRPARRPMLQPRVAVVTVSQQEQQDVVEQPPKPEYYI